MSLHALIEAQRAALHKGGVSELEYTTADYRVGMDLGTAGKAMYIIVNRVTGVVEYASSMLPDTISTMRALQSTLDEHRKVLAVVPAEQ